MERQGTLYEICIYKWKNLKRYKRHAGTGGAGHSGGKYILPGLINMHVHLAGNGKPQKKQRDNEALVKKIMSNGLTKAIAYHMVCGFAKDKLYSGGEESFGGHKGTS